MDLGSEARAFLRNQSAWADHARQMAALHLLGATDLASVLQSKGEEKQKATIRIRRLIERERLKGSRQPWCYDLNRHIALKQVLDRLTCTSN